MPSKLVAIKNLFIFDVYLTKSSKSKSSDYRRNKKEANFDCRFCYEIIVSESDILLRILLRKHLSFEFTSVIETLEWH